VKEQGTDAFDPQTGGLREPVLEETVFGEKEFLSLRLSRKTLNRTIVAEIDRKTILRPERERAEMLFLTDIPYLNDRIAAYNIAVLPIALSDEMLDAFPTAGYLLAGLEGVGLGYLNRVYERFHQIPWRILETERTLVREMTVEDVSALYEIYKNPSITRYTENLFEDPDEERAYTREYINTVYRFMEFGVWIVEDKKEKGRIIGRIGLSLREGFDDPELGYVIAEPCQKRGYATEVCRAIISYMKEQFEYKTLRVVMERENEASHRLCKKLDFVFDRTVLINGKEMEQYILALT
jgi:RimJ/RimL family protein N-acetyltransferase